MAIVRSAEKIMIDQGYAAVTFRSVAAGARVTPGLVQYYSPAPESPARMTDDPVRRHPQG
jgi:hypothetical protein